MDLNDELKNMLLEQFFGMGKNKKKDLMKIEVKNLGYGAEVGVTLHDDFADMLEEEDKKKIGEALKPLFKAMDEIMEDNIELQAWIRADESKKEHDCENCPEETKKTCQDLKKAVKENMKQALTEVANKSKGVN